MRKPEDVVWLHPGDEVGVIIDLEGAALDAAGAMSGTAARLVIVRGQGDEQVEQPLPMMGAREALELGTMLLLAAGAIDPDLLRQHAGRVRTEAAAARALALTDTGKTH